MKTFVFRFASSLLIASLLLAGQGVRPAYAASYLVNSLADNNIASDGYCTLREAIESANNAGNGDCGPNSAADDTITFSVSGTITLGSTLPNIVGGQGALTIDGGGVITISGGGNVRVMWVNSGADLTLQNLTIANGMTTNSGGGIYNNGGALTITSSTLSGNRANNDGGGVFSIFGALTITNSTFSNNTAMLGGGIFNAVGNQLTITNSVFSNNSANGVPFNGGGGIWNDATLTITNSTFSGNSAQFGGGIFNDDTLTIANSTFSGNSASNFGGGVFSGTVSPSTLTIANSTFSGNSAGNSGGGLLVNTSTATLQNTIIANSTSGGDCVGTLSGLTINNLIEDSANACGLVNSVNGNIVGFDPNLGALTGSPAYFPLLPGSLAIDAGDNPTCANPPVNNLSQNGVTRSKDGDNNGSAICDIGSYEAPSLPPTVVLHSLQAAYTGSGPASFTVTYNKAVADPPGNSSADDVTNPANYLLIEKGPNVIADTASCASGVSGDDTQQTVTAVSYNASTFTATVTLAAPLPVGNYRLFVCGTTSIVSLDDTPLNNGADFTFDFVVRPESTRLPATGFPMGRVTELGAPSVSYTSTNLILEIPSLNVQAPIVGVLKSGETWDVSWLGNSVGWLEGSAFPTWAGNTVLTGHVWDADNTPGVFARIRELQYGNRFYIHAFGQTYVYEVRENARLWGTRQIEKVFQHEELDWVTLLTCEGYNPVSGAYLYRRMVRAVLVEIK